MPFELGKGSAQASRVHQNSEQMPYVWAGDDSHVAVGLAAILAELESARAAWPPYNSAHEGLGVLMEEVNELQQHVFTNQKKRDIQAMRKECIQVAAVALRFLVDIANEERGRR